MFAIRATIANTHNLAKATRRGVIVLANIVRRQKLGPPVVNISTSNTLKNLSAKEQSVIKEVSLASRYSLRTHTCGELRIDNVGDKVKLCGWLEFSRLGQFLTIKDSYGSTQVLIPQDKSELQQKIQKIPFESVLEVTGTVVARPENMQNKNMKTGDIEVLVDTLEVLNQAQKNIPILIRDYNKVTEVQQLKYRYLYLRHPQMQKILRMRSNMVARMREFLVKDCDFVDIDTPTLFKKTPGGAQEFVVPTRHPGQFYTLVQSPQQFKQLLMVGGCDRYFQVARCYRDEGARPDRQPEFSQLDLEMSFVDQEGIMRLTEDLLAYSWPEDFGLLGTPFERMTYDQAMELYGSDKPDLRIPYQLQDLTDVINQEALADLGWKEGYKVYAVSFSNKASFLTKARRKDIKEMQQNYFPNVKLTQIRFRPKTLNPQETIQGELLREEVQCRLKLVDEDAVFVAFGPQRETQSMLGRLLVFFTDSVEAKGEKIRSSGDRLLWITDFPLFSYNEENQLESSHHPFTQPHPDDLHLLDSEPGKVRGLHYDLVMNGCEIAGGSIRIHEKNLQEKILKILNIDTEHLAHMLEALENGAPPHGGIALGLDRLVSLLWNVDNIKNVIAFPKSIEGRDLMSGAPAPISPEDKRLYHLTSTDD